MISVVARYLSRYYLHEEDLESWYLPLWFEPYPYLPAVKIRHHAYLQLHISLVSRLILHDRNHSLGNFLDGLNHMVPAISFL